MSTTIPSGGVIKRKGFSCSTRHGKTLGRLATQAASVLAGKLNAALRLVHRYGDHARHHQCGKIDLTGLKSDQKLYRRYTGFLRLRASPSSSPRPSPRKPAVEDGASFSP